MPTAPRLLSGAELPFASELRGYLFVGHSPARLGIGQAALDEAAQWQQLAPLRTKVVPVNNARAEELLPHVRALLSERGSVTFDPRTNVLIIRDVAGSPALSF